MIDLVVYVRDVTNFNEVWYSYQYTFVPAPHKGGPKEKQQRQNAF